MLYSLDMNKQSDTKKLICTVLQTNNFAVLATEGNGQPHASLIAITPLENCSKLFFATYRNTLKYSNLKRNSKLAFLIENREVTIQNTQTSIVLTIVGYATEINIADNEAACQAHLSRHSELESFLKSSDCALFLVTAQSYQIVIGIDDIRWIKAEELDFT